MSAIPTPGGDKIDRTTPNHEYDIKVEQCATCRFWQPDQHGSEPEPTNFGYCRRRPPTIINAFAAVAMGKPQLGQQQDMDDLLGSSTVFDGTSFPGTYYTEWCGEFGWLRGLEPITV